MVAVAMAPPADWWRTRVPGAGPVLYGESGADRGACSDPALECLDLKFKGTEQNKLMRIEDGT